MYESIYILVYTCTYISEQCTYMFIPLYVCTMYVLCTHMFILFQKVIYMYTHFTFPDMHMHVCTMYKQSMYHSIVYTQYIH
jgi:hypothetical protein